MAKVKTQPRPDRLFRALADPTRIAILRLLQEAGELCVCDLVSATRVPQPTASRHLAYLRRVGLVAARKDGLWSHYRLIEPRDPLHRRLLDCIACCGAGAGAGATMSCGDASNSGARGRAKASGRNRCC
jgi:ArsR family transcriptional regulator